MCKYYLLSFKNTNNFNNNITKVKKNKMWLIYFKMILKFNTYFIKKLELEL